MLLFKYTANAEAVLRTEKIKISAACDFNDPFELSPLFDCDSLTPKLLRDMFSVEHVINNYYFTETNGRVPYEEYKRDYLKQKKLSFRVAMQNRRKNEIITGLNKYFAMLFDRRFRLFCGSKVMDSILMWSHYAANHEGCVIGFDLQKPPFQHLREFIADVEYQEDRATYRFSPKQTYDHKDILAVAKIKHTDWSYEKEVRVMFPTTNSYYPIPCTTIRTVIFGARFHRIHQDKQKAIHDLLNEPRYRHVEMQSASLSQDKFRIECKVLRPMS